MFSRAWRKYWQRGLAYTDPGLNVHYTHYGAEMLTNM